MINELTILIFLFVMSKALLNSLLNRWTQETFCCKENINMLNEPYLKLRRFLQIASINFGGRNDTIKNIWISSDSHKNKRAHVFLLMLKRHITLKKGLNCHSYLFQDHEILKRLTRPQRNQQFQTKQIQSIGKPSKRTFRTVKYMIRI